MALSRVKVRKLGTYSFASFLSFALILSGSAIPSFAQERPRGSGPEIIGQFSRPFEEDGDQVPRCWRLQDGYIMCKPTASSLAPLVDGRILYWSGVEGEENYGWDASPQEFGPDTIDARARIMDFNGPQGEISWSIPGPEDGGSYNPQIAEGDRRGTHRLDGNLGIPGRQGDGLVGSTIGSDAWTPTSPPDDPQNNDGDMFCANLVQLFDGRVMVTGGTDWYNEPSLSENKDDGITEVGGVELEGIRNTRWFSPQTNRWTQAGDMKFGRWYPAMITMPDGKVQVFGGVTKLVKDSQLSNVRRVETYDPVRNFWFENYVGPRSEASIPLQVRMKLMPDGKAWFFGNGQQWTPAGQAADEAIWALIKTWDPNEQVWTIRGAASLLWRSGAAEALLPLKPPYDKATVLMAGGMLGPSPSTYVAVNLSEIYTVNRDGSFQHDFTGPMNFRRWFGMAVVQPDGKVFAVNGGDADEVLFPATEELILESETFDPTKNQWETMAKMARGRGYHNSAALMADGNILVGSNSPNPFGYFHLRDFRPGGNGDKDPSFEIYSPPYMFRGPRPNVTYAPTGISYGRNFTVRISDARDQIESVMLTRLIATTHVNENDQRGIFLNFRQQGNTLTVQEPPNGTILPPGPFYLWVNKRTPKGPTPAVAPIVFVGSARNMANARQPLRDSLTPARKGSASQLENTLLRIPGEQACPGCKEKGTFEPPILNGTPQRDEDDEGVPAPQQKKSAKPDAGKPQKGPDSPGPTETRKKSSSSVPEVMQQPPKVPSEVRSGGENPVRGSGVTPIRQASDPPGSHERELAGLAALLVLSAGVMAVSASRRTRLDRRS